MSESLRIRVVQPGVWLLTPLEHARTQLALSAYSAGLSHGKHARRYAPAPFGEDECCVDGVGLPWELATEYGPVDLQSFDDATGLLGKLRDARPFPHMSTWEHSAITFLVRCSRIASHEIVRHRNTAYTQQSTRYVEEKQFVEFIKPPEYSDSLIGEYDVTENAVIRLPVFTLDPAAVPPPPLDPWAVEWIRRGASAVLGYRAARAAGVKRESARYELPHLIRVFMTITANFRQLRYFTSIRGEKHAAPEMQVLASGMRGLLESIDPVLVEGEPEPPH